MATGTVYCLPWLRIFYSLGVIFLRDGRVLGNYGG